MKPRRSQALPLRSMSIEVVQVFFFFFFCRRVSSVIGREGVERPYLCVGIPEDSFRKRNEGSFSLLGCVLLHPQTIILLILQSPLSRRDSLEECYQALSHFADL